MRRLTLCLMLICAFARGDFETWLAGYANATLGGPWRGAFEIQNRLSESSQGQDRLLVRPAVGYQVNRRHSLWLGYAWTPTFYPAFRDEQRLWQQALAQYISGDWSFAFRFRFEQRFIEGGGGMQWRWREHIRVAYRLRDSLSLVFWDEFFFGLNANALVKRGFDQNRAFLGPEFLVGENLNLAAGYLNVLVSRGGGVVANHVLSISLYWQLNSETPVPSPADADTPPPPG